VLRGARSILQGERDWQSSHEVHIADIHKRLVLIVRELAKGEVGVYVRVRLVEDRRLDKSGPRIEEELQLYVLGEPDATTGYARDSRDDGVAWCSEWDGDVLADGLSGGGGRGRVEGRSAI